MAVRYAVATGNWSNVATWDGGVALPDVGDTVYANGYTIALNYNINVATISTEQCPITEIGGGVFTAVTGYLYTCNIVAGYTNCMTTGTVSPISIIGNIAGSYTHQGACGITTLTSYNVAIYVTGDVRGGSKPNSMGIFGYLGNIFNITGNVTAGLGTSAIYLQNGGLVTITGNVKTESNEFYAVYATNYSLHRPIVRVIGTVEVVNYNVIFSGYKSIISGIVINKNGINAIMTPNLILGDSIFITQKEDFTDVTLRSSSTLESPPAISNVRAGVIYGLLNNYTGILAVPPKSAVVSGVPTDDGVGTWAFANELITRLQNCATVESTGEQLEALIN